MRNYIFIINAWMLLFLFLNRHIESYNKNEVFYFKLKRNRLSLLKTLRCANKISLAGKTDNVVYDIS